MKKSILSLLIVIVVVALIASFSFVSCKVEEAGATETIETTDEAETTETEVTEETETVEGTEATSEEAVVITVGMSEDFQTMDVLRENAGHLQYYFELIYDGLCDVNKDGEIVPALAESWEISDDLMSYTFHLRKGVKFHNGRELTAEDVKKTIEWASDPEHGCFFGTCYSVVTNIDIIDPYTVKLTVNVPNVAFINNLTGGNRPILPIEQYNADGSVTTPIGTGPYKFVEWVQGDHFTVEKNPDFWGGDVNVDQFIFKPITDLTVKAAALKTGEVDIVDTLNASDVVSYKADPEPGYVMDVSDITVLQVLGITFGVDREPFNDVKVRQALAYALDAEAICDAVTQGLGIVPKSYYPTGFWNNQENGFAYPFDPEMAKQLLAEAGYPDGFKTSINVLSANKVFYDTAVLAQQYWAEIGVEATIDSQEQALWTDNEAKGNFDTHIAGTGRDPDPSVMYDVLNITGAPYPGFFGNFTDPEIDRLCIEAKAEKDPAKRKAIYDEVNDILAREVGIVWILTEFQNYGYRDNIEGMEYAATGPIIFDNNLGWPQITKK